VNANAGSALAGVQLPDSGHRYPSAAAFLHSLLRAIIAQFPDVFAHVSMPPTPPGFLSRRRLARVIEKIEPARGASVHRQAIARFAASLVQQRVVVERAGRKVPLEAAFSETTDPLAVVERDFAAGGPAANGLSQVLGDDLRHHVARLERARGVTPQAARAVEWTLAAAERGALDLSRQRFALLGGTAELSPIALLLSLGADVFTTHTSIASLDARIVNDLGEAARMPGRLFIARDGADLLRSPVEVSRSIIEFACGSPIHVGALAYKGGEAREWRLAAAMDGIIRAVRAAGVLGSVFYYLTASMVTEITADTASVAEARLATERSLLKDLGRAATMDVLFRPNVMPRAGRFWTRSVLPDQGASYMGANLFEKVYAAETFAADSGPDARVRVSANIAPITSTASTATRQTALLFPELASLGVEVLSPALSRRLMGCLLLHDLLNPLHEPTLSPQQVHGGVFTSPWALDSLVKLALLRARIKGAG
jgi:hypothetical protein